jgi:hypothetical protein
VALDGNATLTLQIHVVEQLRLHITGTDSIGKLQQAVGKGTFTVVDMGDYAEIANMFHVDETGVIYTNETTKVRKKLR